MWELDHKEGWGPKSFWIVVLEKTPENLLNCKEIKPVNPKGNQFWIFIGRTGAEAEAPILWLPDVKSWLVEKGPDAGKDWGQEEKQSAEDEVSITDSMNMNLSKLQEIIKNRGAWYATGHGVSKSQTGLSNWTTTNFDYAYFERQMFWSMISFSWAKLRLTMGNASVPLFRDNPIILCLSTSFRSSGLKSLSQVQVFVIPWTVARLVLLSMGLSRQEYWSG